MLRILVGLLLIVFFSQAGAQNCPGADDEPIVTVTPKAGPSLVVCGFEDHELETPAGKHTVMEFQVFHGKKKVFASEPSETFWVNPLKEGSGLELTELWFLSEEEAQPALRREIICDKDACKTSKPQCVLHIKNKSPFPKALFDFEQKRKSKTLNDDAEELLDQIWVQALNGDKKATQFYLARPPGLSPSMRETFESNQLKLKQAKDLKCPSNF